MNLKHFDRLSEESNWQASRFAIIFLSAGIFLIALSFLTIFLDIYRPALISSIITSKEVPFLIFIGVLLIGVSQIFSNDPRRLNIITLVTVISLLTWVIYLFLFFYARVNALSASKTSFYISLESSLQNSLIIESLRIFLISSLVTYTITFSLLFLFSKSLIKFSPFTLGIGLIFGLILVGDVVAGTVNSEFYESLMNINGINIIEEFSTFSVILISLAVTVAFISYFFPKLNFFKLFFTMLIMGLLLQLAFFYETSIAYVSGELYNFLHGRYIVDTFVLGFIEILIFGVLCYIALEFSVSIKNKRSIMELLSILTPVFGTAFILLIMLKLIGSSLFMGSISINVGPALVLYFVVIVTATITIFFSRAKVSDKGNFSPILFPLLILVVPMLGSYSIRTALNFQILLIYTIIIITSAVFIADTLSILLAKVKSPVMGKLTISYIVNEDDFSTPVQEEKPSEQIIIDDTVKKPIPTYWIGKKIWDHMITETDNSFDPSFFYLSGITSSKKFRKFSIMVLKQYSSHGIKLAFDSNILNLMEKRFNGLKKLNEVQNVQQALEIHFKPASVYLEDTENYKNAPPVVIMEDIQKIELTSLDFSLGTLKSKQVFLKVIMEILTVLEKAHSVGIIHGNISKSTVFIESNGRASEFLNVYESDHILDNLVLSNNIRVKLGGFGGEPFEPYLYREIFGFIPYYYPPEYAVKNLLSGQSWDIYELSCLIYDLLSEKIGKGNGNISLMERRNFIMTKIGNNSLYDSLEQMTSDIGRFWIQPLYEINKNVSPDLWNAVKKGLEPNPKSRFSSISEMKQIIITVFRENYRLV